MSFYLSLTVILTSHFSNITYFRQQQQQNKPIKYYEILRTHTETPRNTIRKVVNLYIEFNYHFLTSQKKIPLLLNRSVLKGPIVNESSLVQVMPWCLIDDKPLSDSMLTKMSDSIYMATPGHNELKSKYHIKGTVIETSL